MKSLIYLKIIGRANLAMKNNNFSALKQLNYIFKLPENKKFRMEYARCQRTFTRKEKGSEGRRRKEGRNEGRKGGRQEGKMNSEKPTRFLLIPRKSS